MLPVPATYCDRDLSWLSFNERLLMEAARPELPILERLNFLSIFASNLDEFYRVRMPAVLALKDLAPVGLAEAELEVEKEVSQEHQPKESSEEILSALVSTAKLSIKSTLNKQEDTEVTTTLLDQINALIDRQQNHFGQILVEEILPGLKVREVHFLYGLPSPTFLTGRLEDYFFERVAAFLKPVWIEVDAVTNKVNRTDTGEPLLHKPTSKTKVKRPYFFPENNKIYLAVFARCANGNLLGIINIPTENAGRFLSLEHENANYILLLDDIIRMNLNSLQPKDLQDTDIEGCFSFKLTRDAAVDYKDDYQKDIAGFIERQVNKRDFGLATRLLYDGHMTAGQLSTLIQLLDCPNTTRVRGGRYHNLKDLGKLPVPGHALQMGWRFAPWPAINYPLQHIEPGTGIPISIFEQIAAKDLMISPPYHNYNSVLRFFNEAAIHPDAEEIRVTLYRIASDSQIAHALMSAARNGKKVTVFVELKARFDEANNIKWAKKMRSAGVRIVYSIWALKVHAKVALVKLRSKERLKYYGIFATGNFNENTATVYADHILMTAHKGMLAELETLMIFLEKRTRPREYSFYQPSNLLVAGFNLQEVFLHQIQTCIDAAQVGKPASIIIKLNNLEEKVLIDKLYEASLAGVQIDLIVRSICCLIPGVNGMSENIRVRRLVDRYLEHSRVFVFNVDGAKSVYLGSADWMNRNIYRRIEVCFPIFDPVIQRDLLTCIDLQLADNTQAVLLTTDLENHWIGDEEAIETANQKSTPGTSRRQAQMDIYEYFSKMAQKNIASEANKQKK